MNLKRCKFIRQNIRQAGGDLSDTSYEPVPGTGRKKTWPIPASFNPDGTPKYLEYVTFTVRRTPASARSIYQHMKGLAR
jgi:hypothetical protein